MYVIILIQVHRMHPCMYLVIFIESSSPPQKNPVYALVHMYIHARTFITYVYP